MDQKVQPFQSRIAGSWVRLESHLPGCAPQPIGILLLDTSRDTLHVRLRPEWWCSLGGQAEVEIWQELGEDLQRWAVELGATEMLSWLESTASHALRIGERQAIDFQDSGRTLDLLYTQHVLATCSTSGHSFTLPMHYLRLLAAAAAGVALAWQGVRIYGRLHPEIPATRPIPLANSALQFESDPRYRLTLTNLEAEWNPPLGPDPRPLKRVRTRVSIRRTLKISPLSIKPRGVKRLQAAEPPFVVANATVPEIPPLPPIPPAPKYRNRNPFLRVLGYVGAPFKSLLSRPHGVGQEEREREGVLE
jgi:hypothetical protein